MIRSYYQDVVNLKQCPYCSQSLNHYGPDGPDDLNGSRNIYCGKDCTECFSLMYLQNVQAIRIDYKDENKIQYFYDVPTDKYVLFWRQHEIAVERVPFNQLIKMDGKTIFLFI